MEKYYRINKEYAARGGFDENVRQVVGDDLVLSERDIRMISLTLEERLSVMGGIEYVEEVEPETDEENGES